MRFLHPKKTHFAIFVVGVAFFAQSAAAPAPPKPENALTGMSGEVGGRHQTASTQDDPGDEFLMSGGLPESPSTQDDPRHGSTSGAVAQSHHYTTDEPDDAVTDAPMIQATLHISKELDRLNSNFYLFSTLLAFKKPVQRLLDGVEQTPLLKTLEPEVVVEDVKKKAVITKVVVDGEIGNRNEFILSFSLFVPKTDNKSPSSVSKTDLRYTGEIIWDSCIRLFEPTTPKQVEKMYGLYTEECSGKLLDNQDMVLVSSEDGKLVKKELQGKIESQLHYHPDLADQTAEFKAAFVLALDKLLAPIGDSQTSRDKIRKQIPTLPHVRWIFTWSVRSALKADSLANNQEFLISLVDVSYESSDSKKKKLAPSEGPELVYAGRIDWAKSLKKNRQGVYELQQGKLTGEIRDLDGKVLVSFKEGKHKIPAPKSTGFFKKHFHV
ncbi:hypothetical protein FB446DRAFT_755029 [Lentinula raphanica]|nr:hypothetical protein FB446DRAFT_755029 [Lentinula raphanica]